MSNPCKIDPNNKEQRRDAAIAMAGRMEINNTTRFSTFLRELTNDYGKSIAPYAWDMYKESLNYYQSRAAMPLVGKLSQLPGGEKWVAAAAKAYEIKDAVVDPIRRVLAPHARSEDALLTGNKLRENFSLAARRYDISQAELLRFRGTIERMRPEKQFEYIDAIESGDRAKLDKPLQEMASVFDEAIKQRQEKLEALQPGATENWNRDYFPRYWQNAPEQLDPSMLNHGRPFAGSQGFRRAQVFASHKEGRELGYQPPKGSNVQDYMLWKLQEIDRYIAAHETVKWLRENEYERYVNRANIPKGWAELNDRLSMVMERGDDGEFKATGTVRVFPETVARLINNHLSPGLRGDPIFRGYMAAAGALNQFRLGLSAFHASFVTGDTAISTFANAIEAGAGAAQSLLHGRPEQAKNLGLIAGKSAIKMFGLSIPAAIEGNKIYGNWFEPLKNPEMAPIVEMLNLAGGRATMDSFYHTKAITNMRRAYYEAGFSTNFSEKARAYGKMGKYILPALAEGSMWPVMNWYIPRLKLGVFSEMAKTALEKMGPDVDKVTMQKELANVWDSVDDRLGQMVYDNTHFDKTFKDAAMASVMAVGWQTGILRQVYGAGKDTKAFVRDVLTPGMEGQFTRRMAYVAALPMFVWTTNALLQAMLTSVNTGKAEWPQDTQDYNEPRTGLMDENGSPQRFMWPNYWTKEVYRVVDPLSDARFARAGSELVTMAGHKLNTPIHIFFDLLRNQDYFGTEIISAEEPLAAALGFDDPKVVAETWKELGLFAGKQVLPFSLVAQKRVAESGGGVTGAVGSFFGVQPLPLSRDRTPFEDALVELRNEREPRGTRTPKEQIQFETIRELTKKFQKAESVGDQAGVEKVDEEIQLALDAGLIAQKDIRRIKNGFNVERSVRLFKGLMNDNVEKAIKLAGNLASQKELEVIYPILLSAEGKIQQLAASEDEKMILRDRVEKLLMKIDPTGEKFFEAGEPNDKDKDNQPDDNKEDN